MKKILTFILLLISVLVLSSCGKKYTPRTMEYFYTDFDVDKNKFDKIIAEEKGVGNFNLFDRYKFTNLYFSTKEEVRIKNISYKIYNHSEDYTFYIYDHTDVKFTKTENVYQSSYIDFNKKIPVRFGQEVFVSYDTDIKLNKKTGLLLSTLIHASDDNMKEDMDKIKEAGGIYQLKIEYELKM